VRSHHFIEESIRGFLAVLEHALESEEIARRRGFLQSLDPRVKVLGLLALIVAAAVSRRLEVILRGAVEPFGNASVHFGDATRFDLSALAPAPTKVVANLPYGVAATVTLRTISELPEVTSWLVMLQREVGERFAAAPGTPAYGVPSVLAQLACEVKVLRPISRNVFRPVPNVDSVLVGLRRHGPAPDRAVAALVHQGFAHRRKALAGSLALAPGAPDGIRERAREALVALGHPADVRAERLSPGEFATLAERLGS